VPDWGSTTLAVLALVIIVLLLPVAWLVARRRWLALRGWVIECSLRLNDSTPSTSWMLGVARFHEEDLELYRVFSFDIRPRVVIRRREAAISATRLPTAAEASVLYGEQRIVDVDLGPGRPSVSLALLPEDMTAFLSWSEASAPGDPFRS
jgi:hypothetical protein